MCSGHREFLLPKGFGIHESVVNSKPRQPTSGPIDKPELLDLEDLLACRR